jgi:hypothetical protein
MKCVPQEHVARNGGPSQFALGCRRRAERACHRCDREQSYVFRAPLVEELHERTKYGGKRRTNSTLEDEERFLVLGKSLADLAALWSRSGHPLRLTSLESQSRNSLQVNQREEKLGMHMRQMMLDTVDESSRNVMDGRIVVLSRRGSWKVYPG